MKDRKWMPTVVIVAVVAFAAAVAGGLVVGLAGDDDDDDEPATVVTAPAAAPVAGGGSGQPEPEPHVDADDVPLGAAEARRVERAALRIAGGGTVSDLSRSDDPGEAYEVEVLIDGGELDIALDENLQRVDNAAYDD